MKKPRRRDYAAIAFMLFWWKLTGCMPDPCNPAKWGYAIAHHKQFPVGATLATPGGARLDDDGQHVSPALVDRLIGEVGDCLGMSIDRGGFVVKVTADWSLSCDGKQQMLSAIAPEEGCAAKGLPADSPCSCRWRALIQCPSTIVTTPSLYLFKDALVRWVAGSQNPWADPALAKCASPSTDPLSRGAE